LTLFQQTVAVSADREAREDHLDIERHEQRRELRGTTRRRRATESDSNIYSRRAGKKSNSPTKAAALMTSLPTDQDTARNLDEADASSQQTYSNLGLNAFSPPSNVGSSRTTTTSCEADQGTGLYGMDSATETAILFGYQLETVAGTSNQEMLDSILPAVEWALVNHLLAYVFPDDCPATTSTPINRLRQRHRNLDTFTINATADETFVGVSTQPSDSISLDHQCDLETSETSRCDIILGHLTLFSEVLSNATENRHRLLSTESETVEAIQDILESGALNTAHPNVANVTFVADLEALIPRDGESTAMPTFAPVVTVAPVTPAPTSPAPTQAPVGPSTILVVDENNDEFDFFPIVLIPIVAMGLLLLLVVMLGCCYCSQKNNKNDAKKKQQNANKGMGMEQAPSAYYASQDRGGYYQENQSPYQRSQQPSYYDKEQIPPPTSSQATPVAATRSMQAESSPLARIVDSNQQYAEADQMQTRAIPIVADPSEQATSPSPTERRSHHEESSGNNHEDFVAESENNDGTARPDGETQETQGDVGESEHESSDDTKETPTHSENEEENAIDESEAGDDVNESSRSEEEEEDDDQAEAMAAYLEANTKTLNEVPQNEAFKDEPEHEPTPIKLGGVIPICGPKNNNRKRDGTDGQDDDSKKRRMFPLFCRRRDQGGALSKEEIEEQKKLEAERQRKFDEELKARKAEEARLAAEIRQKDDEIERLSDELKRKEEAERLRLEEELRRQEEERKRLEEEERRKQEEEEERLRLEEEERVRQEEEEEKRRLEEEIRVLQEKEEAERKRIEDEERQRQEKEEESERRRLEEGEGNNKLKEEEEQTNPEEEEEQTTDEDDLGKPDEEAERKKQEEEEERKRREEEDRQKLSRDSTQVDEGDSGPAEDLDVPTALPTRNESSSEGFTRSINTSQPYESPMARARRLFGSSNDSPLAKWWLTVSKTQARMLADEGGEESLIEAWRKRAAERAEKEAAEKSSKSDTEEKEPVRELSISGGRPF